MARLGARIRKGTMETMKTPATKRRPEFGVKIILRSLAKVDFPDPL